VNLNARDASVTAFADRRSCRDLTLPLAKWCLVTIRRRAGWLSVGRVLKPSRTQPEHGRLIPALKQKVPQSCGIACEQSTIAAALKLVYIKAGGAKHPRLVASAVTLIR